MADLKDKMIGGFRILAEIKGASGSQGQIFKAVCENPPFAGIEPGTVVALKAMAVQDEEGHAWAKLEKRTEELVRLSHPNVVKYYGCFSETGTFNDIHAIVQEFLEGETLKQRLARCPSGLDADEAHRVTESALAGLEYTASKGIVHRDVKPGNIFLCTNGEVKLIDFEIARQEGGTTTSASGNLVGSFDYMAPDFTNPTFRGDERSDVFSMGVVMHEAITGRTPYQRIEGGNGQANFAFLSRWARLHVDGTSPIRISSRANRLLAHSEEVLAKALAPLPEDRYESFAAFRAGLKVIRYRDLRNGDNAYRILQVIGKGGFGEVFKARLKKSDKLVAIKHLLKAAYAERFYREAKIMAKLHDPCFVRFIDFFVVDHAGSREPFLVMDFLPGMPGNSLRDAIKRAGGAGLSLRETLLAFARFAHGLSVLHARGIYHRDIKPSNLYYPEGHPERAAIMDLGIARDIHGTVTTTGQVPGTLDYMPPEVVLTKNRGEAGMDIYALGLCLYEALSGKNAYPRLPQGPAAITAFLARANIKAMPDLSAPVVLDNAPIHDLLVRMTHPELAERLVDTREVERRLLALAEEAGGEVGNLPDVQPDDDAAAEEALSGTATIPSLVETRPDRSVVADFGTRGTIATKGTVATGAVGAQQIEALEKEGSRVRHKRLIRGLAIAAASVAVACGVALAFRGRFVEWMKGRAVASARQEAERVTKAYAERGLEAGRREEGEWLSRWTPGKGGWVDLDEAVFVGCTNRIRAAETALQNVAAEHAAGEVESAYERARDDEMDACDARFGEWRAEWSSRCSPEKFAELEGRIKNAREGRQSRKSKSLWDAFRKAGNDMPTQRYQKMEFSLEKCDEDVKKWRRSRPHDFPEDDFRRLNEAIERAREQRVHKENERTAGIELEAVVKAYSESSASGDKSAESWLKKWEGVLKGDDFQEKKTRIASAKADRVEFERQERVKAKIRTAEGVCLQIKAEYRDDSSNKKDADAKYDEWKREWEKDVDLPAEWFAAKVKEVEAEKEARARRERAVSELAEKEKADVVQAYGDEKNKLPDVDQRAATWRKKWQGELGADAYALFNGDLESAREKRVNYEEWTIRQRALSSATNAVETARAELVNGYEKFDPSTHGADERKSELDARFANWAGEWETNAVLQKSLPNWFAGQKSMVETAKSACESRIDEVKKRERVAAKTDKVVSVRKELEDGYKIDPDKAKLDRRFNDWMAEWIADSDLPPGWFAEQRGLVEKVKAARETRDMAVRDADLVCDLYRTVGVPVGDGRREKWNGDWTGKLDAATFRELSQKIDAVREERVSRDKDKIVAEKMKAVESECAALVTNYGDAAVPKTTTDNRYARDLKDWEADEVLKAESLQNWFAERKGKVEDAMRAREESERKSERERIASAQQRIAAKTNEAVTVRRKLESAYRSDASDKDKADAAFTAWKEKWRRDEDLPSGWFDEQSGLVDKARLEREARDAAKRDAQFACELYRTAGRVAGDALRKKWVDDWTGKVDATTSRDLLQIIDGARAKAAPPPPPKPPVDALLVSKTNGVASACANLVADYANDAVPKADTDERFRQREKEWNADKDLTKESLRSWLAERKREVEGAKREREDRDAMRRDASETAQEVCEAYRNAGLQVGDVSRKMWERTWTSRLHASALDELSRTIDKARAERVQIDDGKMRILASMTNQVASACADLVKDYANDAIPKADTDERFRQRAREWDANGDLKGDSLRNWLAGQKRKVEDAQASRLKREKAEGDRAKATAAANGVCDKYASGGVDAGNSARQLWEVEWKPLLDETTYADISAVIDHARDNARDRAEQARVKAEAEQLEKEVRALLEADQNQVERWKSQLADAERKIMEGRALLGQGKADELLNNVRLRKKWVVGVVANRTERVIEVGGRSISPGRREFFEIPDGMPPGGWQVNCAGYKPLTIDQAALDGSVVSIGDGQWRLEPIPKARVRIPRLPKGVTCTLGGSGEIVSLDSGKEYEYAYRLKGHQDQEGRVTAQGGELKELDPPGEWQVDPELEEWFQTMLDDAERSRRSELGKVCLQTYHKIYKKGYVLNEDDLKTVEEAYKLCSRDIAIARQKAITDGRYKLKEAEEAWTESLRLYNELTGKRVTVEEEP